MNSLEVTSLAIRALEEIEVEYILVGAFSSNAYSFARATKDADFVIVYQPGILGRLMERLGTDFKLDAQLRLETLTHSFRNIVTYLPTKFDLELFRVSDDPHHVERFSRRRRRTIAELNCDAWIPTAEDVIIQKLRWQRRRDVDDALNVMAVQFKTLDWDYLDFWTQAHETANLLKQLKNELPDLNVLDDRDFPDPD